MKLVWACLLTSIIFFVIAVILGRLADHAASNGDLEATRKWSQHELITGVMPVGIALYYWIFG